MSHIERKDQLVQPLNIPWNQEFINSRLHDVSERVSENLENGNDPRNMLGQTIVVKTANAPHLLHRFLTSAIEMVKKSSFSERLRFGVVDDSTSEEIRQQNNQVVETLAAESGLPIELLATHFQDSTTIIGRLRNILLQKAQNNGFSLEGRKGIAQSLQLLLTDRFEVKTPDDNPLNFSDEWIREHYSSLGGGPKSTTNVALLLNAYLAGRSETPLERSIFTLNDDDIVYGSMVVDDELPKFTGYDFLQERKILFSDPETQFVGGKYVGTTGNPTALIKSALEIATDIITTAQNEFIQDNPSPYHIYDYQTDTFKQITVREAFQLLPEIINHFLARVPLTGFKLPDTRIPDKWIFDQGNFSLTGKLAAEFPFPVTGFGEFIMLGVFKTYLRHSDLKRALTLETPIIHLRSGRVDNLDIYAGKLIAGTTTSEDRLNQLYLETLLNQFGHHLDPYLKTFFQDERVTAEILSSFIPKLAEVRGNTPEVVKTLRDILLQRLDEYRKEYSSNHPLIASLTRLTNEVPDEILEKIFYQPSPDEIKMTRLYTKKFIRAAKIWPDIIHLAWELGYQDHLYRVSIFERKADIELDEQVFHHLMSQLEHFGPLYPSYESSKRLVEELRNSGMLRKLFQVEQNTNYNPLSHAFETARIAAYIGEQINSLSRQVIGINIVDLPLLYTSTFTHDMGERNIITPEDVNALSLDQTDFLQYFQNHPSIKNLTELGLQIKPHAFISSTHIARTVSWLLAKGFPEHASVAAHGVFNLVEDQDVPIERLILMLADIFVLDGHNKEHFPNVIITHSIFDRIFDAIRRYEGKITHPPDKSRKSKLEEYKRHFEILEPAKSLFQESGLIFPPASFYPNWFLMNEADLTDSLARIIRFLDLYGIKRKHIVLS
ncbi:hypothetical protein A3I51_06225 [Candidatus Gottesmanbacteria bacterium RIFCSPLOWO2_02_FULL_38_8]|uniref:Uncharacterized protein n=1 Tax=Candidatus Gottesmanbacteria bacterium RIFCSPLOWO2_02_FULL_38_8 TaxID=1798397 RepID=A0A1F6B6Y0_9BACT|nr:MAG: hypothetical protein A3I51_06225 [Candidatus Gottesmanbacteria bacterium RIFCSPLOWO2_02_FULL_38_8]